MKRAALFFAGAAAFALVGWIPGPQGSGLAQKLSATTAGTGEVFSWEFSNGDRLDVTATRTFSGVVPTLDVRAWYGDGFDYDGPAVMNIGYFYNDGGFIGDDQQWWGADNYGFSLGRDKGLIWTDIDATYSDVTGTDREIALYSGSASAGMGRHILRLAGRAPDAVDPGFPWDASGVGTGADLEPVYLSLAGVAPMVSSSTFIVRDEGGDPAITVETDGVATFAAATNFTQTAAADSTAPTHINLPTGGTAAQAGWVAVEVNGSTAWIPYWQ